MAPPRNDMTKENGGFEGLGPEAFRELMTALERPEVRHALLLAVFDQAVAALQEAAPEARAELTLLALAAYQGMVTARVDMRITVGMARLDAIEQRVSADNALATERYDEWVAYRAGGG